VRIELGWERSCIIRPLFDSGWAPHNPGDSFSDSGGDLRGVEGIE